MRNTKIVHQVTLKHMKMNKKRTVLSIVGIALMVMLLTCVFVGKDTAFKYFVDIGSAKNGSYHYAVYDINKDKLNMIRCFEEVTEVGVTEDLALTEFDKSANPERPFLNIRRYSPDAMKWMNIKVVEGRLPENDQEIVVSESAIREGSAIGIGDKFKASTFKRYIRNNSDNDGYLAFPLVQLPAHETVELPFNMFYIDPQSDDGKAFYETHEEIHEPTGFSHEYTVVGIIETPVFESGGCAWYAAISAVDESTLQNETFNALLMTDTNKDQYTFTEAMRNLVGAENFDSNESVLIFSGNSSENALNFIVKAMQIFFVVLIALISVMLIYNVFALSFDERAKYLGMLSSVGATGKQKRSSVYFEAFALLIPSLPIGFIAGLGVVKAGANWAGPMAQKLFNFDGSAVLDMDPELSITPLAVLIIILLSAVTVFISALIPARKISKVGPIESIRGTKKSGKTRNKAKADPDRLINRSVTGMLSSRFLKNDKSKSFGIIRAVAIFFLVTVTVYFGSSLLILMVNYKLQDNSVKYACSKDRKYVVSMYDSRYEVDFGEIADSIRKTEGVTDITVCKGDHWALYVDNDSLSDEYWDAYYQIVSMYYPAGQYSKDDFLKEYKLGYDARSPIGIIAFEDDVFNKMAKETNALSYADGELPCILLNNTSFSTDQYGIAGKSPRDYKYVEVNNPFAPEKGGVLPVYPAALTRDEAIERGYNPDEIDFPEIELDGPADLKIINKVQTKDIGGYLSGSGDMAIYFIVPMSVADYIDKINATPLSTLVFFNCDNQDSINYLSASLAQLEDKGAAVHLMTTSTNGAEYKEIIAYLIRIILIIFTTIASAICLLNVYSSISALTVARRKHFAILKSMGSTFKQLIKTEFRESSGMLIRSFLIAAPLTGLICWWLSKFMIRRFGYFTVSFPWLEAAGLIVFIVAAVLLMTFICLRRENKIDIIDEIKRESV